MLPFMFALSFEEWRRDVATNGNSLLLCKRACGCANGSRRVKQAEPLILVSSRDDMWHWNTLVGQCHRRPLSLSLLCTYFFGMCDRQRENKNCNVRVSTIGPVQEYLKELSETDN